MKIAINLECLQNTIEQTENLLKALDEAKTLLDDAAGTIPPETFAGKDADLLRGELLPGFQGELSDLYSVVEKMLKALKDAQESCYKCKNYCNDFPEAVTDGMMPSLLPDVPKGILLTSDGEQNETVRNQCEAAAEAAVSITENVRMAEDLISQLKRATVPHSEALQDVLDRTKKTTRNLPVYEDALSVYRTEVEAMDSKLYQDLTDCIPAEWLERTNAQEIYEMRIYAADVQMDPIIYTEYARLMGGLFVTDENGEAGYQRMLKRVSQGETLTETEQAAMTQIFYFSGEYARKAFSTEEAGQYGDVYVAFVEAGYCVGESCNGYETITANAKYIQMLQKYCPEKYLNSFSYETADAMLTKNIEFVRRAGTGKKPVNIGLVYDDPSCVAVTIRSEGDFESGKYTLTSYTDEERLKKCEEEGLEPTTTADSFTNMPYANQMLWISYVLESVMPGFGASIGYEKSVVVGEVKVTASVSGTADVGTHNSIITNIVDLESEGIIEIASNNAKGIGVTGSFGRKGMEMGVKWTDERTGITYSVDAIGVDIEGVGYSISAGKQVEIERNGRISKEGSVETTVEVTAIRSQDERPEYNTGLVAVYDYSPEDILDRKLCVDSEAVILTIVAVLCCLCGMPAPNVPAF